MISPIDPLLRAWRILFVSALVSFCAAPVLASMLGDSFTPNLPPPPRTERQEADQLVKFKTERTPERMRLIQAEATRPTDSFFFEAAGLPHYLDACPSQARFTMTSVTGLVDAIYGQKRQFSRPRPNQVLADVSPAIAVPWHASYPSGHATQARLLERIFSAWYPEKAFEFQKLSVRIAHGREIAGLHYPSDSAAGFMLADQAFERYMLNVEFKDTIGKPCMSDSTGFMETIISP